MAAALLFALATIAAGAPDGEGAPVGYAWTVDLGDGGVLDVKAPIATVETVMPLPLVLSTRNTTSSVKVQVCETWECLLPHDVVVDPGAVVHVDALFAGRAPRLKVSTGSWQRECCDRGMSNGRAIAFAGPTPRSFAFASAFEGNVGGVGAFAVDTGTFLAERPELISAFGAVVLDDGWPTAALRDALRQFANAGGVVSIAKADATAIGLVDAGSATAILSRSSIPTASYGPVLAAADGIAVRLDDRVVKLRFVEEDVVRTGAGVIILRAAGRAEDERIAAIPVADPGFLNVSPQLDPRNVLVVNVAAAGLAPTPMGVPGFSLAFFAIALIGVTLLVSLKRGPVVAARNTLVVGVIGAAALVGLRIGFTAGGAVAVSHWSGGQDGRRVVSAFARAPNSFGDVDVDGAPFAGKPTLTTIVGSNSWRNHMSVDNGRVHAALSSSSGLVGLWFTSDQTPGGLVRRDDGSVENAFGFPLDYVLLRRDGSYGGPELVVIDGVAAGAVVTDSASERREHFGSVVEERLARDVLNSCGSDCVVGIFTKNGVVTAVEASR